MVLVRLAYAADLPPPGELARRLADGAGTSAGQADGRAVAQTIAQARARRDASRPSRRDTSCRDPPRRDAQLETRPGETENPAPPPAADDEPAEAPAPLPELNSFDDVVALAEAKRDLKLKHALLEQVRLVRFKPGTIELSPLPQAPRELGQELMRKLKAWTGRVWIVAVSDEEGAQPLGQQRREKEAREIETIREHPARQAGDAAFPRRAHRRRAARGRARAASRTARMSRKSSRRTGPTDEEFRRDDEAGAGAARPHGRDAGRDRAHA